MFYRSSITRPPVSPSWLLTLTIHTRVNRGLLVYVYFSFFILHYFEVHYNSSSLSSLSTVCFYVGVLAMCLCVSYRSSRFPHICSMQWLSPLLIAVIASSRLTYSFGTIALCNSHLNPNWSVVWFYMISKYTILTTHLLTSTLPSQLPFSTPQQLPIIFLSSSLPLLPSVWLLFLFFIIIFVSVERSSCPLKVLKLSRADVDDFEVAAFMEVNIPCISSISFLCSNWLCLLIFLSYFQCQNKYHDFHHCRLFCERDILDFTR